MAGDQQVLEHEINELVAENGCFTMAMAPPGQESEGTDMIYHDATTAKGEIGIGPIH
jgi:hypothetical protein